MEKTCTRCAAVKPIDAFKQHRTSAGGRRSVCRDCENTERRERHALNRAEVNASTLPDDFDAERYWRSVGIADGCWNWAGSVSPDGYGFITHRYVPLRAHRVAVMLSGREIPAGRQVDHLCRNRRCVNPSHLDVVTPRTNTLRSEATSAINARKTHCKRGHEFTKENTRHTRAGERKCRACDRLRCAARRATALAPDGERGKG